MLATALAATTLLGGHSVEGRPIHAVRRGDPDAPRRVLVVGSIHGDEPAGIAVVRALRRMDVPAGTQVWTVRAGNPDGLRRGTRWNARGVDLNRNFAHRWRPGPRGRYHPGPRAFSEPESRALRRLILRVRPQLTVWYHQPYGFVVRSPGRAAGEYARRTGMAVRALPAYRGTATGWQRRAVPGSEAFVVELGPRAIGARAARRHARAVLAAPASEAGRSRSSQAATAARPRIRWNPIPFGTERKRQMRRYARRHYGMGTHLLRDPRTIVQHYTGSSTFSSAWNTFASNARDPELRELPGVCTHFLIDRGGSIHQLVSLKLMCRHVIGLNHVAIGIEHVGTSDAQVMGTRRQLAASLRLTRWLMSRHGIPRRHVIGHTESLDSPFHHERVRALRNRTHGDFAPRTMRRYRSRL